MHFINVLAAALLCGIVSSVFTDSLDFSTGCSVITQVVTTTVTVSESISSTAFPASSDPSITGSAFNPTLAPASFDPQATSIASLASPFSTISSMSTLTSYSTLTNYITVYAETTTVVPDPADPTSSVETAYYYAYLSGSISWLNGAAPPSTYDKYITETIEVTVYPVAAASGEAMSVAQPTITLDPNEMEAYLPTGTSTVSLYLTHLVTSVTTLTETSSRFRVGAAPGPRFSGWNSSSNGISQALYPASLADPTITGPPVTITESLKYASLSSSTNYSILKPASVASYPFNATGTAVPSLSIINPYTVIATAADPRVSVIVTASGPDESTQAGAMAAGLQSDCKNVTRLTPVSNSTVLVSAAAMTATSTQTPGDSTAVDPLALYDSNQTIGAASLSTQYSYRPVVTAAGGTIVAATASASPTYAIPTINGTDVISVRSPSNAGVLASGISFSGAVPFATGLAVSNTDAVVVGTLLSPSAMILNPTGYGVSNSSSATVGVGPAAASYATSIPGSQVSGTIDLPADSSPSLTTSNRGSTNTSLYDGSASFASNTPKSNISNLAGGFPATSTSLAIMSTLTTIYANTTNVNTGSLPTPSVCGEHGNFTLTWDDEPDFSPTNPLTDPSQAAPVFDPYHHLYFSAGFVYLPEPNVSYTPISTPHLAMYLTNGTGPSSIPGAGGEHPGEIGAGDRASESAFWFNAYSAYMGCDNDGPDECTMQISGYVHQGGEGEVLATHHNISIPACPHSSGCALQQVFFPESMVGLSGVQFQAFVDGEQISWFMDNLALGWYDNSCAAGLLRTRSQ